MKHSAMKYLGQVEPATVQKAEEVLDALQRVTGKKLSHTWGKGSSSEHATGRAIDFMVFRDKAAGDFIANYIWEHRKRLGLQHIIWYQRIISTEVSPGVWRRMGDRKSPTENHMDHPHVLFKPGPYVAPGGTAGSHGVLVDDGDLGPLTIKAWQRYLNLPETGKLTRDVVRNIQSRWLRDPARSGQFTKANVRVLQQKVSAEPDGIWGPLTTMGLQRFLNKRLAERNKK